jgi:hypothetical protein
VAAFASLSVSLIETIIDQLKNVCQIEHSRHRSPYNCLVAFLDDCAIPFDNNQAEQDLRMLKVQQKIAGSFRTDCGSEAFARIRGYLSSMRKQRVALLAALQTVFTGQPLYPAFD